MSQALAAHDALARSAVEHRRGTVVKMTGDGVHAVFDNALDALAATLDMQQALADPATTCGLTLFPHHRGRRQQPKCTRR